jgi:hypothetical protein
MGDWGSIPAPLALGIRGSYGVATSWGELTPTLRLEYRHVLTGDFTQSMFYSDIGSSVSYLLNQHAANQDLFGGAVGLRARAGAAVTAQLEYGVSATAKSVQSQTVRAITRFAF